MAQVANACTFPQEETPAARVLELGVDGVGSVELLALIIGGEPRAALLKGTQLLAAAGSLNELARLDPADLARFGISPKTAARVVAAIELGKRAQAPRAARTFIDGPESLAKVLMTRLQHRDREHFGIALVDAKLSIIGIHTVTIGQLNAAMVHPRETLRAAIVAKAYGIVLWHCHPSGSSSASPEDVALTRRLAEGSKLLGIELIDHLIIGDGSWSSMRTSHADIFQNGYPLPTLR